MLFFGLNLWGSLVAATTALIVLLTYVWLRQRYAYWRRRGIPYVKPAFLFGNMKVLLKFNISFGDFFRQLYFSEAAVAEQAPVVGVFWFHTPALVIRHTELIRRILIKDSNLFLNRYEAADALHDNWGAFTLPLSKYPIWRESRKRMSEFFTSGRMKQRMYPLMLAVSLDLEQHIGRHFSRANSKHEALIEVKELCALYTTDLTALLSFSIKADSLKGNMKIRQAVIEMFRLTPQKGLHFFLLFFLPQWTGGLRAKVFPDKYRKFISKMLKENLNKRRFDANANFVKNTYQDDLIDLLLRFQNYARHAKKYEWAQHADFVGAQVAIMLIAGFETSSSLIAFILYELAKQPDLQLKLKNELKTHFHSGEIVRQTLDYEELQELTYLQMVVAEGLRMYPAAAFINREYTPNENDESYSLRPFVDFDLPKGMPAYISILGLHHDEKYWPNPSHFDPERFHPERVKGIEPMTYIPFGAGPHACIGSRLGALQVKLGLVHILKDYSVELTASTPKKIVFEPTSFMLHNKGGIELKFLKDSNEFTLQRKFTQLK